MAMLPFIFEPQTTPATWPVKFQVKVTDEPRNPVTFFPLKGVINFGWDSATNKRKKSLWATELGKWRVKVWEYRGHWIQFSSLLIDYWLFCVYRCDVSFLFFFLLTHKDIERLPFEWKHILVNFFAQMELSYSIPRTWLGLRSYHLVRSFEISATGVWMYNNKHGGRTCRSIREMSDV